MGIRETPGRRNERIACPFMTWNASTPSIMLAGRADPELLRRSSKPTDMSDRLPTVEESAAAIAKGVLGERAHGVAFVKDSR